MKPLRLFLAVVGALVMTGCKPPEAWLDELNLYPDAPTCSYATRDCQTHWLLCSALCERTTDGVSFPRGSRPQRADKRCASYRKGARRICADVRGESFESAICADYEEGWCEWEVECLPRPVGAQSCSSLSHVAPTF